MRRRMRMYLSDKEAQRAAIRLRVAANIRHARKALKWSMEDLSVELEVDWRTVVRWEHAEVDLTLFDASRCAKALKIPLEELISE